MTAIAAEGIKYKLDMDFVRDDSSYAFRLIVDENIQLGIGRGKMPQVSRLGVAYCRCVRACMRSSLSLVPSFVSSFVPSFIPSFFLPRD